MANMPKERGQGLAEYAFLISLVVLIVIVVLVLFGQGVEGLYQNIVPPIIDAIKSVIG